VIRRLVALITIAAALVLLGVLAAANLQPASEPQPEFVGALSRPLERADGSYAYFYDGR
jgi:hypothetical protein